MKLEKLLEIARAMKPAKHPLSSFHVSFVLHKNKIISIAANNNKTHPTNLKNPIFDEVGGNVSDKKRTCSELAAYNKAKRTSNVNFRKCTLINIRFRSDGSIGESCPCKSCKSLLNHVQFKKVIHTDDTGNFTTY